MLYRFCSAGKVDIHKNKVIAFLGEVGIVKRGAVRINVRVIYVDVLLGAVLHQAFLDLLANIPVIICNRRL